MGSADEAPRTDLTADGPPATDLRRRRKPEDRAVDRRRMVERQLRNRGIRDERVLDAMARVPREWFIAEDQRDRAYTDEALPIDAGQTISQPYMVAEMTQLLAPSPDNRVLEIGTGSGYQAAVLATLGARVLSIERHPDLATTARRRLTELAAASGAFEVRGIDAPADAHGSVEVRVSDGSLGAPADGVFDGIVVTAAAPAIPVELRDQLADGGRLVIPVGPRDRQVLMRVVRHGNDWTETPHGACVFVPLIGPGGFPE